MKSKHVMYRGQMPQSKNLVRCSCGVSKVSTQTFEEIENEHLAEVGELVEVGQ